MHDAKANGVNGDHGANGVNGTNGVKASVNGASSHHPLDPLTGSEIESAVDLVRKEHGNLFFNAVTIQEPRKADMLAWLEDPEHKARPARVADVVCLNKGGKVLEGLVDLDVQKVTRWDSIDDEQPLVWRP